MWQKLHVGEMNNLEPTNEKVKIYHISSYLAGSVFSS